MPIKPKELTCMPQNAAEKLLSWYDENRRDLPWRGVRDPYATWVS